MTVVTGSPVRRAATVDAALPRRRSSAGRTALLARVSRVLLGVALIALSVLPIYRMLRSPRSGLAGEVTVRLLDLHFELMTASLLLVAPFALLGAFLLPPPTIDRACAWAGAKLARPGARQYALLMALLAAALAAGFALLVLEGKPNHIDSIAQLLHARFWASGRPAGPISDGGGFWAIQNAVFTEHGWVSQYPPGHVLVLTLFTLVGAPWLAGPAMVALTVWFATLLAHELFPTSPAKARLLALLVALSPFFLLVGASFMNHVTAAAATVAGAYALARAWRGSLRWGVVAGFAFGYALATRPLSSAAMAVAIFCLLPFAITRAPRFTEFLRIGSMVGAGAVVPVGALLAYNHYFFGSASTFGYVAALGPRMRLGFQTDPWGNWYGITEAIGYTSSELMALGINLFESAVPALLVIGLFLLIARKLHAAERLLAAWALAPVVANLLYWHHGLFMGPRMLHESAPAWAMLAGVAAVHVVKATPAFRMAERFSVRSGVFVALAASLAFGVIVLAPQRAAAYGGEWLALTRAPLPRTAGPALVFVHDAWTARIGMTLASGGYRLDTVETLLRQNSTCAVDQLASAVAAGARADEQRLFANLDTTPRATNLPPQIAIAPDDRIRVRVGEALTPACAQQARSDRAGILDLAPYLWRGDLPGSNTRGTLFVRDLGPARNAKLIAEHRDRRPLLYVAHGRSGATLYDYEDGMRRLWQEAQ